MRFATVLALALAIGAASGRRAHAQAKQPFNPREFFLQLDANNDTVIDRDEVPDSARAAFDTLLKYGDLDKNGRLELSELRGLTERIRAGGLGGGAMLLQRFKMLDKNGDGKLSRDEFPGQPAVFERIDADKDGFITQEEIAKFRPGNAGLPAAKKAKAKAQSEKSEEGKSEVKTQENASDDAKPAAPSTSEPAAPRKAFGPRLRAMDKDGDGKITREEYQGPPALFDRLDANHDGVLRPEEIRPVPGFGAQRFKALDKNGDGRLSRDEFPGPPRMFDRLDADKDGQLTRAEAAGIAGLQGGARDRKKP